MEVSLNPGTTVTPQPISATAPHQFLPPTENGKYPNFAEIYKAQKLQREQEIQEAQAADSPSSVQSAEQPMKIQAAENAKVNSDVKANLYENIVVKTNENVSLQTTMKLDFQRDVNLLARILNNR
jgi:hypothetical protein